MIELNPKFYDYNGWSFSKYQLWNKCKKAYYFQYIGGYVKGPLPFDSSNLYRLKKDLTPKVFLQGQIIHKVIANQINQNKIRDMNEASAINHYASELARYRETANDTITEYFNGEPVDIGFFDKIDKSGIEQIKRFFSIIWPPFLDSDYIDHENKGSFQIDDIKVLLRPDYVSRTKKGMFVISDWKTGSDSEDFENDKQIATYVLWAIYNFKVEPKEIRSELVYLSSGVSRSFSFTSEQLEETKRFIIENYRKLNESYDYNSFQPNPLPKNCMSCNYAKICDCKYEDSSNSIESLLVQKKKD